MTKHWERRDVLKTMGVFASSLSAAAHSSTDTLPNSGSESSTFDFRPDKSVTAITIGAGDRGNVYGDYAVEYPWQLDIVGVAEPIEIRNQRHADKHNIAEENRFTTWEHVFEKPKFADAVVITTPDNLHYGPCIKALKMGYDVLLEKPIAPTEQECRDILKLTKETGRVVAVCHVLRYAPYFIKLRDMIRADMVGELVSIQHLEPIRYHHMAHSYVRGNWHNSQESTPIILAKSCHDLDILRWMVDEPCESIAAYGDLKWFRSENAPTGSTPRCTDGCAIEATCPYSALRTYYRKRDYTYVFDLPENPSDHGDYILNQLRTTNYGRCVYYMDNDQPDHYVTSMQFENGVTANFSMEAFTASHGRRTRIMGSMGEIVGDMTKFTYTDFRTEKVSVWSADEALADYHDQGHGGGDSRLVRDWVMAVSKQDSSILTSTIDVSIESHVMSFKAEESRLTQKMAPIEI